MPVCLWVQKWTCFKKSGWANDGDLPWVPSARVALGEKQPELNTTKPGHGGQCRALGCALRLVGRRRVWFYLGSQVEMWTPAKQPEVWARI